MMMNFICSIPDVVGYTVDAVLFSGLSVMVILQAMAWIGDRWVNED